jgi:hypothetical protein
MEHNKSQALRGPDQRRVTFYCGQAAATESDSADEADMKLPQPNPQDPE